MRLVLLVGLAAAGVVYGCRSGPSEPEVRTFTTFDQQVAYGAEVFENRCAKCHGDAGQGSDDAPPLVGPGALPKSPRPDAVRQTEFRTAMDIAAFATKYMPPSESARKKMKEHDYWAVLAFALSANGVQRTEPVGPHNAASIVIHP